MKVLIIGSNGQLGKSLISTMPKSIQSKIELVKLSKKDLNLLDIKRCKEIIQEVQPNWTINAAAYTNVEKAEEEPFLAKAINTIAPQVIANEIYKQKGKLLHISTDFVFSGKQNYPYNITQTPYPINTYGKTKAEGEYYVNSILMERGKILRTSWLYGPNGKNFLFTMLNLFKKNSNFENPIKVVYDQFSCPTSTESLSRICWRLIELNKLNYSNFLHWSDKGKASWFDFAISINKIANELGLINKNVLIKPITSEEYKSKVKRPHYSLLDCTYTKELLSIDNLKWEDNLKLIMNKILKNKKYLN